ncbi:MAG: HEAT repeat domain-containing protein [Phycisphaeraceae bacterium]|nr:HEAT repeat domain-containing protein [Phycisphaeraceae bacterium]
MPASTRTRNRIPIRRAAHIPLCLLACLFPLAGCDVFDDARPGATSIFDVFAQPTPSEAVQLAIDPYNADNRYRGTMLLSNAYFAGNPVYLQLFEDRAQDSDATVRIAGTRALANHGSSANVPILVKNLKDKDALVRLEAARGLQRLHNPVAIEPLMDASRDPDLVRGNEGSEEQTNVRTAAATALGQYPNSDVVQHLITIMSDSQLSVNEAALSSLSTMTGQNFGFNRREWLDWYDNTTTPFVAGTPFIYPVFNRPKKFIEYLPFVSPPPNEIAATPAGMPPIAGGTLVPLADINPGAKAPATTPTNSGAPGLNVPSTEPPPPTSENPKN